MKTVNSKGKLSGINNKGSAVIVVVVVVCAILVIWLGYKYFASSSASGISKATSAVSSEEASRIDYFLQKYIKAFNEKDTATLQNVFSHVSSSFSDQINAPYMSYSEYVLAKAVPIKSADNMKEAEAYYRVPDKKDLSSYNLLMVRLKYDMASEKASFETWQVLPTPSDPYIYKSQETFNQAVDDVSKNFNP